MAFVILIVESDLANHSAVKEQTIGKPRINYADPPPATVALNALLAAMQDRDFKAEM